MHSLRIRLRVDCFHPLVSGLAQHIGCQFSDILDANLSVQKDIIL